MKLSYGKLRLIIRLKRLVQFYAATLIALVVMAYWLFLAILGHFGIIKPSFWK